MERTIHFSFLQVNGLFTHRVYMCSLLYMSSFISVCSCAYVCYFIYVCSLVYVCFHVFRNWPCGDILKYVSIPRHFSLSVYMDLFVTLLLWITCVEVTTDSDTSIQNSSTICLYISYLSATPTFLTFLSPHVFARQRK